MNKQEIQNKLEQAQKDRQGINDNILWLKEQLAEAEKPKFRHGDFGFSWDNTFVVVEQGTLEGSPKAFFADTSGQQRADKNMPDAVIFGNIFDLMKDWGKDLEYFEFDVHHCEINTVEFPHAPIHIAGNWHTLAEAEEIWHKLGQLIATLKRKEITNEHNPDKTVTGG